MARSESASTIQTSSARLTLVVTILFVALWILLLLERFGPVAAAALGGKAGEPLARRIAYQLVAASPEVMYLLSLWWIRQSLATYARGDLYAPIVPRMLSRVGILLAAGALLNVFVVPGIHRALGMGPGYWIAFDVAGLVLGAIGLSLAIVARVLDRARELKAELDEIF